VGIYRSLLDEIVRRDYHVLDGRISIRPWRKLAVALRAIATQ
jgi:15-cis-phytoene synthase